MTPGVQRVSVPSEYRRHSECAATPAPIAIGAISVTATSEAKIPRPMLRCERRVARNCASSGSISADLVCGAVPFTRN